MTTAPPMNPPPGPGASGPARWRSVGDVLSMLVVLAALCVLFGRFSNHFWTPQTVRTIVNQFADLTVVAVGMTLVQRCHHLWRLRGHAELKKLRLHLSIYGSFVTGAVMGPVLYVRFGRPTLLAPLGVLVALVIFDTVIGFREAEHSAHGTNPVSAVPTTPKSAGGTTRSA